MRKAMRLTACLYAALFAGSLPVGATEPGAAAGAFDFYVLSLSWSPSYCAAEGAEANRQQCGASRPYAFVVHGLWPQNERGYPEYCSSSQPERVPDDLVGQYRDIMPSGGLIGHQWRKHGSCSGLSQETYFALTRKARARVTVPEAFTRLDKPEMVDPQRVEAQFLTANPGLEGDAIAVTCDRRYLREVRICMTRDLEFRACEAVDRKHCRRDRVLMPPARGG
ncbi:ribonuclease T2 family protein [Nitratireductor pacificus]|uniref:Ribonuclease T2 n=1 Tax=Nitratireductor pacificus pht-3B TaxID=391937 RepID=K2N869_9HYPH|nr:ribonuclease T(2) [Nitratireductor pacificus]EKF20308.1 ribonuclease T2 [Nitratireductor pacificus pht-3B]